MRTWIGSFVFIVSCAFALASGCGSPEVVNHGGGIDADASVSGGGSGGDLGSGANGGGLVLGEGGEPSCPSTCQQLNADCGFVTDARCDTIIECPKPGAGARCPAGEFCGGDGPNRCGFGSSGGEGGACTGPGCVTCTPKTCDDLGYTCGPAGDTCGGRLDCGPNACAIPGWTCGGGKTPGQCGCVGECSKIPDCSAKPVKTTTLTGKVYDPAGKNPLYHVFVYVSNDPNDPALKAFPPGITCDVCGATAAGDPMISEGDQAGTYTDVDGSFVLKNVPVDQGVTVVIQLGRWRRVFQVDIDTPCAPNAVPDKTFLMPSNQTQGNIPLMAMVTGHADSLECVLRKMGIDGSEFTNPAGGGRVQFYLGTDNTDTGGNYGQKIDTVTPKQSALFALDANNQPTINSYDMTILACQGAAYTQSPAALSALRNYAATGGRVFTTHYSYTWLANNDQNTAMKGVADNWSEVATWHVDENDRAASAVGHIDLLSNPKGAAFQGWLEAVNASVPGSGTADVVVIRHDTDSISSVAGQTQQWLYRDGVNHKTCSRSGQTCTSNVDCARACSVRTTQACTADADCNVGGRVCRNNPTVVCVANADCGAGNTCVTQTCPTNTCGGGTDYSGQHLPLHFTYNTPVNLVQDLNATPPALQCGRVLFSDFHVQDAMEHDKIFPAQCGVACTTDAQCTALGKCVGGVCLEPMNAQEKLLEYMIFDLGSCVPPPKACVPATECPASYECGYADDGCNGLIACGICPTGESCNMNKCVKGPTTCVPRTCAAQNLECGPAGDGCGDKIDCGQCAAYEICEQGRCVHVN